MSRFGAVLIAAVAILAAGITAAPGEEVQGSSGPVVDGKIGFSGQTDNPEIFAMHPDGSGRINLTNHPGYDTEPAWSRDGSKIAFASDRSGTFDIHVMNADGSAPVNLTDGDGGRSPAWSPDGTKIAFVRRLGGSNDEIFVMNADGSSAVNITNDPAFDGDPSWSPDGRIAFISNRDTDYDVYVMNADGSGEDNLTEDAALDRYAAWSPDGSKIAHISDRAGGYQLHVVNPDGSGLENLTNDSSANDGNPSWSPGGSRVIFHTTTSGGGYEIFTMNRDGSDRRNLTNSPDHETDPTWQPLPVPAPSVSKAKAQEGKPAKFKITIPAALPGPVTYDFETDKGKAKRKDFKAKQGTVTFAPGETTKKIKVKTKEDRAPEPNERFFLVVSYPGGPSDRGRAKIKDDD